MGLCRAPGETRTSPPRATRLLVEPPWERLGVCAAPRGHSHQNNPRVHPRGPLRTACDVSHLLHQRPVRGCSVVSPHTSGCCCHGRRFKLRLPRWSLLTRRGASASGGCPSRATRTRPRTIYRSARTRPGPSFATDKNEVRGSFPSVLPNSFSFPRRVAGEPHRAVQMRGAALAGPCAGGALPPPSPTFAVSMGAGLLAARVRGRGLAGPGVRGRGLQGPGRGLTGPAPTHSRAHRRTGAPDSARGHPSKPNFRARGIFG